MIVKGTLAKWQSQQVFASGIVKDCYKFKSKEWADKYGFASLIEQPDKKFVLKLASEISSD